MPEQCSLLSTPIVIACARNQFMRVACALILYMPQEDRGTADLGVLLLTVLMHFWWIEYSWCIVRSDKLICISGGPGHC